MILVIRISGDVDLDSNIRESLNRMNIRRKYSATLIHETPENKKLLNKVRNYVAYGTLSDRDIEKLIEARGQSIDKKKIDAKKIVLELGKKSMKKLGMKPFFRLHPPRGGIESKKHFGVGKGVLGDHGDKIVKLMEKML